jgi:glycosyltransferase involved in cell wall biosynthesis
LRNLKEFIGAADLYITPYLNEAQITSGTLAYTFGAGKAVVSTPYWHAAELLAEDRGVLVPFGDAPAIAREVIGLLRDDTRRTAIRKNAYRIGREMVWSNVARLYMRSFEFPGLKDGAAVSKVLRHQNARPKAAGTAEAEAESSLADDRFHRSLSTRRFQRSEFFRRLLHRR